MKIEILGTQLDITPSIKKYIEEKIGSLDKMVSRFEHEGDVVAYVEIARSTKHHKHGDVFYAEATLGLPGKTLRAEHEHEDIRGAIDMVRDTLRGEMKKYKEIEVERKKRSN